jgi:hypothetical protein
MGQIIISKQGRSSRITSIPYKDKGRQEGR